MGTEREAQALAMRCRGATWRQVADELGCSTQAAYNALERALARAVVEITQRPHEMRAREAALLDELARALITKALDGDVRAQDTLLRNRQRYAALLGLDLKPPDVTVDQSQNVIVLPAWGEAPATVDGQARELGSGSDAVTQTVRSPDSG